ncbi:protein WVD2-like 5 isoform X2 [Arabidopsis lyrata subsp. lyrata]|uniref:protein WVD2-like 5 isoform X2 n=1 Tax=Arabidopsis lyrata subsp. lyrata TaxID=81972 RepID=UPI000A29E08E|nr:protein WVD2-like 5 isoform X2 [Arabidopsis lyrata subsp. lyrata]|eukprot:XP_020872079.1 protein WVD2-like 5 isoform X2 [Arabidopsis lyrata subsp. lyrata]
MDPETIMAADGTDSAPENGALTMESVCGKENGVVSVETVDTTSESQNENSGNSSTFDAIEHVKEAAEGTQVEIVDDSKCMKPEKAQRKLKHEKLSGGKNISSVHIKKNKEGKSADAKVAASNGSVAPIAQTTKPLKSKSFNGREAQVTKQGKHDTAPAESVDGDKVKPKPQKKQTHETSEDDTQSSNPKADDGKPRKVGALPNYGFSFKCDQRAEKRREFYVKLEEKTHAKEEEINSMQAKSKETQEAELRMLRKSLNFKATPMPSFYQEPQPPKTELKKKIPPTRPKSPKLGRKKTASGGDCEETQTPRLGRLSLDERASKDNPTAKGIMPTVDLKKQPVRKSLPRLPSQKTALPDGKPAPAKAATISAKVKPEKKKLEKDTETVNQSSHPIEEEAQVTVSSSADAEDSHEIVSPRMNEDRADKSIEVSEAVAVEH